ncbi:hypothetical protein GJAV_G00160740 [Gymnothorax javanicus]|nr:hypothetical protein GJAV_G00160740 [Gymnothorax javanicus]
MITLLAPFEELTQQISSSSATAADVIPSIKALTRLLEKTADSDHGVKTSKTTLLEAVQRRFADIESENLYVVSTILDPRSCIYCSRWRSILCGVELCTLARGRNGVCVIFTVPRCGLFQSYGANRSLRQIESSPSRYGADLFSGCL